MTTRRDFVRGALTGGGVAAATLATMDSRPAHAAAAAAGEFVSVRDYGAPSGGNDGPLIQNAIDTGKNVYFPPGEYVVENGQLTISTPGQILFGDGHLNNEPGNRARIMHAGFTSGVALIFIEAEKVTLQGLVLEGAGNGEGGYGLALAKSTDTDDVDANVFDCVLKQFSFGIHIHGRGLRVEGTNFTGCADCICVADWPDVGLSGNPNQIDPEFGAIRAFNIQNNRGHNSDRFFVNEGSDQEFLWGLVLANNLLDVGGELFVGSARYSAIVGNVVTNTGRLKTDPGPPPIMTITKHFSNSILANNVLSGTTDLVSFNPSKWGIRVQSGAELFGVTLSANSFSNISEAAIDLRGLAQRNVTITGNSFDNIGFSNPSISAAIKFHENAEYFAIVGNAFRTGDTAVPALKLTPGTTITGFEAMGNTRDRDENGAFIDWNGNTPGPYNNISQS